MKPVKTGSTDCRCRMLQAAEGEDQSCEDSHNDELRCCERRRSAACRSCEETDAPQLSMVQSRQQLPFAAEWSYLDLQLRCCDCYECSAPSSRMRAKTTRAFRKAPALAQAWQVN